MRTFNQTVAAKPEEHIKRMVLTILGAWFVLALVGSVLGVFDSTGRPPALLGAMARKSGWN